MSAPAAIQATFADFRLVKGRKVGQLVFEVPLERADDALRALGGLPQAQDERWCGIARMAVGKTTGEAEKSRKSWSELNPSAQAAIRCADEVFIRWYGAGSAKATVERVRHVCGVKSRSELDTDDKARNLWMQLDAEFQREQRGIR